MFAYRAGLAFYCGKKEVPRSQMGGFGLFTPGGGVATMNTNTRLDGSSAANVELADQVLLLKNAIACWKVFGRFAWLRWPPPQPALARRRN